MGVQNVNRLTYEGMRAEIGRRLRAQRAYQGMTQVQVAEAMGVQPEVVRGVENRSSITLHTLIGYARVVGVPLSELLADIEPYKLEPPSPHGAAPGRIARALDDESLEFLREHLPPGAKL